MPVFKCKMCGGDLSYIENSTICECEYCGAKQTLPNSDNEKKINLFNRANRLRMDSEYDRASAVYENIVAEFPDEAEAYWGLCLCTYGIEYVDDPLTGMKIPTCHRTLPTSILDDSNYKQACDKADTSARVIYSDEAKKIDEIQKNILSIALNEAPYDVFICYKESNEAGGRTEDSVIAQEIYDALTAKGLKVFFSRITLEDKLGVQYEPYIYSALNSAKVMLAVGTSFDNFDAVWVKNEWSRYLHMMKSDSTKALIPCFKDLDAYDLPKEFKGLQAQDMSKIGWLQDLVRGVEKICDKGNIQNSDSNLQQINSNTINIPILLERAILLLEDGEWAEANTYLDKILDNDPNHAMAYVGKLMSSLKIKKQEDLKNVDKAIEKNNYYQKALRFADDELSNTLKDYARQSAENEKIRIEKNKIITNKITKISKKTLKFAIPIAAIVIVGIILLNTIIMPKINSNRLINTLRTGNIGDTIKFGTYEQDNNTSNGKEKIEWQIIAKDEDKVLVISKYALDAISYGNNATWEKCSLRNWLNNEFYNEAFSDEEHGMIAKEKVPAGKNPEYDTDPGNDTTDKVFLLSINEVNKYFSSDEARKCVPTEYAIEKGAWTSDDYKVDGKATCWWWVRSPGDYSTHAASVSSVGVVRCSGNSVHGDLHCVRPALWIEI